MAYIGGNDPERRLLLQFSVGSLYTIMSSKSLYTGLLTLTTVSGALAAFDCSFFNLFETIEKDVVIVGGGGSGAHAAVRLREDYNKSVVLIEKEPILVRKKPYPINQTTLTLIKTRAAMLIHTLTPRPEYPGTTAYKSTSHMKTPWISSTAST